MKVTRQEQIVALLKDNSYMTVEQLAQQLFFSKPTVRRDLTELERKGIILRSRGGASLRDPLSSAVAFDLRNTLQAKQKADLATRAAALIEDGDVIFLDASTTVLHMLKHLQEKRDISVITNSIQIPLLLRTSGIPVFSTGGRLISNSLAYGGSTAEQMLDTFHIDKLFFSSYAVTSQGDILDYSEEETALRKKLLRMAKKSVFLCDSTKIGRHSLFHVASIKEVDHVITDGDLQIPGKGKD